MTEEHKRKIAMALKGNTNGRFGRGVKKPPHTEEWKKQASERMVKENQKRLAEGRHNLWRGGVSNINDRIRQTRTYRLWREAVFKRDNYTCVFCKVRGRKLNADHILPFAYFPAIRFSLGNGRTLCHECHKQTDTYSYKCNKYKPRFIRWIIKDKKMELMICGLLVEAIIQ